jgi:hypothetical protein
MSYAKGIAGADLTRRTTFKEFPLGTTERFEGNKLGIYVLASEAVATGTCTVNSTTFALTDTGGLFTATAAFASGEYGWVHRTIAEVVFA